jgi:hypothetical protein
VTVDTRKTLQELEGQDWGEPSLRTYVVTECHRLRRVPLENFSTENLRLMIGQRIGLDYLVPLALARLSVDPFAAGDFYAGDLLTALLSLPAQFWAKHPDLQRQATHIARDALRRFDESSSQWEQDIPGSVRGALKDFLKT